MRTEMKMRVHVHVRLRLRLHVRVLVLVRVRVRERVRACEQVNQRCLKHAKKCTQVRQEEDHGVLQRLHAFGLQREAAMTATMIHSRKRRGRQP